MPNKYELPEPIAAGSYPITKPSPEAQRLFDLYDAGDYVTLEEHLADRDGTVGRLVVASFSELKEHLLGGQDV